MTSDGRGTPTDIAVSFRGVTKSYRSYRRPVDRLLRILVGRTTGTVHEVKAVDGIDLDIRRGETFGLIGRNGSGKSTLLRILSGITRPDSGTVEACGRIAPLLALGAGFNPDFTGRENIFLNAAVLGMSRRETRALLPSIEAFADIGEALDRPVRTYSSGMFARLAFAVASSGDPEILIVDEILSVGDASFARKCFARIEEIQSRGTTIIFVSHSANMILELCDRAALLERGRLELVGPCREVVKRYFEKIHLGSAKRSVSDAADTLPAPADSAPVADPTLDEGAVDPGLTPPEPSSYPSDGAEIESIEIIDRTGRAVNRLRPRGRYKVRMRVRFSRDAEVVTLGISIRNAAGVNLAGLVNPMPQDALSIESGDLVELDAPIEASMLAGTYFLSCAVRSRLEEGFLHRRMDTLAFAVEPDSSARRTGYFAVDSGTAEIRHTHAARPTGKPATLGD